MSKENTSHYSTSSPAPAASPPQTSQDTALHLTTTSPQPTSIHDKDVLTNSHYHRPSVKEILSSYYTPSSSPSTTTTTTTTTSSAPPAHFTSASYNVSQFTNSLSPRRPDVSPPHFSPYTNRGNQVIRFQGSENPAEAYTASGEISSTINNNNILTSHNNNRTTTTTTAAAGAPATKLFIDNYKTNNSSKTVNRGITLEGSNKIVSAVYPSNYPTEGARTPASVTSLGIGQVVAISNNPMQHQTPTSSYIRSSAVLPSSFSLLSNNKNIGNGGGCGGLSSLKQNIGALSPVVNDDGVGNGSIAGGVVIHSNGGGGGHTIPRSPPTPSLATTSMRGAHHPHQHQHTYLNNNTSPRANSSAVLLETKLRSPKEEPMEMPYEGSNRSIGDTLEQDANSRYPSEYFAETQPHQPSSHFKGDDINKRKSAALT